MKMSKRNHQHPVFAGCFAFVFFAVMLLLPAIGYGGATLNRDTSKNTRLVRHNFTAPNLKSKNDSIARHTSFIDKRRAAYFGRLHHKVATGKKNRNKHFNLIKHHRKNRKINTGFRKAAPALNGHLFAQLGNAIQMEALHFKINALVPSGAEWKDGIDSILQPYLNGTEEYDSILVVGYTDNTGSKQGNLLLSEQRAKKIAAILIQKGIPENRIRIAAMGEEHPVTTNTTSNGRSSNRRVEINFLKGS